VTFAPSLGFLRLPGRARARAAPGRRHAPQDGHLVDADGHAWTPLALGALAQDERFLQVGL
jgi:twitching motility protein PilI